MGRRIESNLPEPITMIKTSTTKQYPTFECNIRVKSEYGDIEIHGDQNKIRTIIREFQRNGNDLLKLM